MSSYTTTRFQAQGSSITQNCDDAERDVRNQQRSVQLALRTAAEPIASYPEVLQLFKETDRQNDLSKLQALMSTIASDCDKFIAEHTKLSQELDDVIAQRPKKAQHLPRHYGKLVSIGSRYIDLNERILGTVGKSVEDYAELLAPTNH